MEIKRFRLHNLGGFGALEVPLAPTAELRSRVTVFVGGNGAGKTVMLRSLATSLSWFVARIRSENGSGSPIPEAVISTGKASAAIEIEVSDVPGQPVPQGDALHHWTLSRAHKGKNGAQPSQLAGVTRLADAYRKAFTQDDGCSLPLITFYPVERSVLDVPARIKGQHSFAQMDGYDNSLNQGVDFRRFFEWFRKREDAENESGISQEVLDTILQKFGKESGVWQELERLKASSRDRQLTAVRSAIRQFMPGFNNLRVRRWPRLHMSIDKDGKTFNILQLSQGEKSLLALVGDIARRLAMMNPGIKNPLNGKGVVLIDEVDLHLHPAWQRDIIERLTNAFPSCQFVLTTHSPLVISDYKDLLIYSLGEYKMHRVHPQYGNDANSVLLEVMNTSHRNVRVSKKISDALGAIEDKRLPEARALISELEQELPHSNIELAKLHLLLRKQELRLEKDRQKA